MALPALVAVVLTVGYLGVLYRKELTGHYPLPRRRPPADRVTFIGCGLACAALGPAVVAGAAPWAAAGISAIVALAVFLIRDRSAFGWELLPWRLVLVTEGLFLVVAALSKHGLTQLLSILVGDSGIRTALVATGASNLINNLPAYMGLEAALPPGPNQQLFATLIGTNAGPLILMWGSLATLLWADRCRARGVRIHPGRFALIGLGAPVVVLAAAACL
jgi:arsenical pump membrane protein